MEQSKAYMKAVLEQALPGIPDPTVLTRQVVDNGTWSSGCWEFSVKVTLTSGGSRDETWQVNNITEQVTRKRT